MPTIPPTVERAYQLAGSGRCRNMAELRKVLKEEGCESIDAQLTGSTIRRDLRDLCHAAKSDAARA